MPFYATYTGHINNGVFTTWDDCKKEIHKKPKYKKFATLKEAEHFHKYGPLHSDEVFDICVYTDGSCASGNGGYGIYFGEGDKRNLSHYIGKTTNNIAELSAVIHAIQMMSTETQTVGIYTDSQYSILCCTTYGEKCNKKGWSDDIPNQELVKLGYTLLQKHPHIKLVHVTAHTLKDDQHSVGNRQADLYAKRSYGA